MSGVKSKYWTKRPAAQLASGPLSLETIDFAAPTLPQINGAFVNTPIQDYYSASQYGSEERAPFIEQFEGDSSMVSSTAVECLGPLSTDYFDDSSSSDHADVSTPRENMELTRAVIAELLRDYFELDDTEINLFLLKEDCFKKYQLIVKLKLYPINLPLNLIKKLVISSAFTVISQLLLDNVSNLERLANKG